LSARYYVGVVMIKHEVPTGQHPKIYNPFSHWNGFTNDLVVDERLMAEFVDFTSNDSDD